MRTLTQAQVQMHLNQAINKVYQAPMPELESSKLIPRGTNGVREGAESFSWQEVSEFGIANFVDRYAKDIPPVGITSTTKYAGIGILADSYSFSYFDLQNAQFEGTPLNARQGKAARNGILLKQDIVALKGDSVRGFTGFVNNPNVTLVAIPNGGWDTLGTTATGDIIVDDVQAIIDAIKTATNGIEQPNRIAIASKVYAKLNNKRMDSNGDSPRVLQYLKDSFPQIKEWLSIDALNGAGVNGKDRVVVYTYDEDALMNVVPMELTQLPEQWAGLAATVNCAATTAGTIFFRPLSAAYADVSST